MANTKSIEKESVSGRAPFELPAFKVPVEKSRNLHVEAKKYSPAGVQGVGRYYNPFPIFMKKAFGARITDVDDNEYIDYHASYGPASLGYNDPRIRRAVIDAMETEGVPLRSPTCARSSSARPSRKSSHTPRRRPCMAGVDPTRCITRCVWRAPIRVAARS